MKTLLLILALTSFGSFASTEANCRLVKGIYENSSAPLENLKFETLTDIFTIRNAHNLSFKLDDTEYRLVRTDMSVQRQTKMIYILKQDKHVLRAVHLVLDRTPKEISQDRQFFGNMIISPKIAEGDDYSTVRTNSLNYNFYCSF